MIAQESLKEIHEAMILLTMRAELSLSIYSQSA